MLMSFVRLYVTHCTWTLGGARNLKFGIQDHHPSISGCFFQIFEFPIFGAKNGKKCGKNVFAAYVGHFRLDLDQTCHE